MLDYAQINAFISNELIACANPTYELFRA